MTPTAAQARKILRAAQALLPRRERGVTILEYHLVGAGTSSPVDISAAMFRGHMAELAETARVVSLETALHELATERVPSWTVVLTFDDAYENFYRRAYPALRAHGFPSTLFVPTGFVEGTAPPPIRGTEGRAACSWKQLREMQAEGGVSVGAHTCTHPSLTKVSRRRARWEIEACKERLEERLGRSVTSFCYPRALTTPAAERVVARTYRAALVGGGVKQRARRFDPHRLQRVPLRRDSPSTLEPILTSPVWLEEWLADKGRRFVK